jgi:hypothetical protein
MDTITAPFMRNLSKRSALSSRRFSPDLAGGLQPIGSDRPFSHAALDDGFEQMVQDVALAKAPTPVFGKVEWSGSLPTQ